METVPRSRAQRLERVLSGAYDRPSAMTLRASGHSDCGWIAAARAREPAHVAVLAGREEVGQALARLRPQFRTAEADRVEAERQRAVADQWDGVLRVRGFRCQAPVLHRRRPTAVPRRFPA